MMIAAAVAGGLLAWIVMGSVTHAVLVAINTRHREYARLTDDLKGAMIAGSVFWPVVLTVLVMIGLVSVPGKLSIKAGERIGSRYS